MTRLVPLHIEMFFDAADHIRTSERAYSAESSRTQGQGA